MTTTRVAWSQQDIDRMLVVIRKRHVQALAAGDAAAIERHEGWMNRLLDARKHHAS